MNRPCASHVGEPQRDDFDAIAAAVERLTASRSFLLLCADEHPGVPAGACATASAQHSLKYAPHWQRTELALEDLCSHYERLDRMRRAA